VSTLETTAAPGIVTEPTVTIRPPRAWGDLRLRELWTSRELVYFLTKRELQIRYKQSFFGIAWAVLQPLGLAFIFAIVFGQLLNVPVPSEVPFPVFALAALVPWLFTAQAVTQGANSLVLDANLLAKVYFPRLVVPMSKVIAFAFDLAVALVVVIAFALLYDIGIDWRVLATPVFLLLGAITTLGVATLLAAINVKYRDVLLAVPVIVQVWFFASPVVYPSSVVPDAWQYVYALNPMVTVIDGVRWAILGVSAPELGTAAVSVASSLLILAVGIVYFRRTEQFFADLV
jgi:lipopolysaccharide transport system permease protein